MNYRNRLVNVGEVHIQATGKKMRFEYTGSASTLGVGVSGSGAFGSYSVGGTVSRSRSQSTSFPWKTANGTREFLDTYFHYGKYCVGVSGGGYNYHKYEVRPIQHEGGTGPIRTPSAVTANYCVPYQQPGSTGSQVKSNAQTWTNGAKLGGAIGLDLSSRTGYASDAKISFEFTTAGRLCGTNGSPYETPRRLAMRAP